MRRLCVASSVVLAMFCGAAFATEPDNLPRLQTAAVVTPDVALPETTRVPVVTPLTRSYETLVITLGGDLGMNPSGQPVAADSVMRHGRRYAFAELTSGLKGHLVGDLVFANLETVVTDRNDLGAVDKAFNFRTHPNAVRHLVGAGFNVLSAANNHAFDYGETGLADTIRHLEQLKATGLKGAPGAGFGRSEALAPAVVKVRDAHVLLGAVGIGLGAGNSATRATMASYHGADLGDAARRLRETPADVRVLSVHFGQELSVRPSAADEKRLREVAAANGIDIVAGHHAHVAAGVQESSGRLIFYGLGNLLHPGMQNMGAHGICRDFGVLATVHLGRAEGETFRVRAVELKTFADMHATVRVRTGDEGKARIAVMNHHAAGLDDRVGGGARGVRFAPQSDGSGLWCSAHGEERDDHLAARCRLPAVTASDDDARARAAAASCGGEVVARRPVAPTPIAIEARQAAPRERFVSRFEDARSTER